MELILADPSMDMNYSGTVGTTALVCAVRTGHEEVMEMLLSDQHGESGGTCQVKHLNGA